MCATCGCGKDARPMLINLEGRITDMQARDPHPVPSHHEGHEPHPHHPPAPGTVISLEKEILAKNNLIAARNRNWLEERNILALNLVSSPGSGKTTLLERTIRDLGNEMEISVIEGDQETENDAERIRRTGCRVVQINTGTGCHLESDMLARGIEELKPAANSIVMIENVGNLVCPALFDLGERAKVLIFSVTEGEDKPQKYPHMFRAAEMVILNKTDLLPYIKFDMEKCMQFVRQVNPQARILPLSATGGEGLAEWYDWLRQRHKAGSSNLTL